jgi:hypothetical protein
MRHQPFAGPEPGNLENERGLGRNPSVVERADQVPMSHRSTDPPFAPERAGAEHRVASVSARLFRRDGESGIVPPDRSSEVNARAPAASDREFE